MESLEDKVAKLASENEILTGKLLQYREKYGELEPVPVEPVTGPQKPEVGEACGGTEIEQELAAPVTREPDDGVY